MIKEVIIKYFQIHKHLHLKFNKGLNLIIGETSIGKSSITRALYLTICNQPRNADKIFKNDFSNKPIEITLIDDNGHKIKRKKKKYYLNDNNKPLKAFGSGIPDPISNLFPFTDTNWQKQHDPPFLIFQTGGSASKILNSSTGLEDQELLLKEIKTDISEHNSNIKRLIKNNQEHRKTIEKLKYIPELLLKTKEINEQKKKINKYKDDLNILSHLINSITKYQKEKEIITIINPYILKIDFILNLNNKRDQIIAFINELNEICTNLKKIKHLKSKSKTYNMLFDSIFSYENKLNYKKEIKEQINQIKYTIENIQTAKKSYHNLILKIKLHKNKFDSLLLELGECPLCGNKIKKKGHKC